MVWAISGGAGFLGLHLARRLVADGHEVRSLDLVGLDDPQLDGKVREFRGDIRDEAAARELVRRRAHPRPRRGRAPDPRLACGNRVGQRRRDADAPVRRRPGGRAPRRLRLLHRRLRRAGQAPDRGGRPARGRRSLRRVEDRGRRRRPRLHAPRAGLRDPPAEDVHRARAARRLRDPLRLGPRGTPDLHARRRLQPVPAPRRRGSRRGDPARGEQTDGGVADAERGREGVQGPSAKTSRR